MTVQQAGQDEAVLTLQKIGGEWRFLKRALTDWLGHGRQVYHPEEKTPRPGSKQAVLKNFGVFRDDDDMEARLAEARRQRQAGG